MIQAVLQSQRVSVYKLASEDQGSPSWSSSIHCSCLFSCPLSSRRDQIPCCLNCASGISSRNQVQAVALCYIPHRSRDCLSRVAVSHIHEPKSGKRVQCALQMVSGMVGSSSMISLMAAQASMSAVFAAVVFAVFAFS